MARKHRASIVTSLAAILAVATVWSYRPAESKSDTTQANSPTRGASPHVKPRQPYDTVPSEHRALYEKLGQTRQFALAHAPLGTHLKVISESLGAEIVVDESLQGSKLLNAKTASNYETPISHSTALDTLLRNLGLSHYGLVLEKDRILIVAANSRDRAMLRTHNFDYRSDYSTAMRRRIIDQIRDEIGTGTWGVKKGTWIAPAHSVFKIAVYHTSEVQGKVSALEWPYYESNGSSIFTPTSMARLSKLHGGDKEKMQAELEKALKKMRADYPFKSLDRRLEFERRAARSVTKPKLTAESEKGLTKWESSLGQPAAANTSSLQMRSESLRRLHDDQVKDFISREGFGRSRLPSPGPFYLPLPSPRPLPLVSREIVKFADDRPVNLARTETAPAAVAGQPAMPSENALSRLHEQGRGVFFSPDRFGYAKSRQEVAGFEPHAFTHLPRLGIFRKNFRRDTLQEHWAMSRLELVSLLMYDKPAVYESKNLPRMDQLRKTQTRPLNPFESHALRKLQEGEGVVTRATVNRIEMMGALRAIKQCAACHDSQRGQLMGAFSYELLRDPQIPLKDAKSVRGATTPAFSPDYSPPHAAADRVIIRPGPGL